MLVTHHTIYLHKYLKHVRSLPALPSTKCMLEVENTLSRGGLGTRTGTLTFLIHGCFLHTGTFLLAELYGRSTYNTPSFVPLQPCLSTPRRIFIRERHHILQRSSLYPNVSLFYVLTDQDVPVPQQASNQSRSQTWSLFTPGEPHAMCIPCHTLDSQPMK